MNKKNSLALALCASVLLSAPELYAAKVMISGKIYNNSTGQPVEFATVAVPEAKVKASTGPDGFYSIILPKEGTYNILVRGDGCQIYRKEISVDKNLSLDIRLLPVKVQGEGMTITGDRDIQKVSRRSMTVEDLKETPASFGDSLNALTSLPGVDRTSGFFGPLVIRSMYPDRNRYYIDGIPLNSPQHFGGIHSVISNSLMSGIDLYSSAFPAKYGGPLSAVIEINTVDKVERFGGYTDVGLISSSALIQAPVMKETVDCGETKQVQAGYVIASGRFGYWSVFIPLIYETMFNEKLMSLPEYYDYQIKASYIVSSNSTVTFLFAGAKDYYKDVVKENYINYENGDDPLFVGIDMKLDEMFNNMALYYNYKESLVQNRVTIYAALSRQSMYQKSDNAAVASWFRDYGIDIDTGIYGLKDDFSFEWIKGGAELKGGLEYQLWDFRTAGKSIIPNNATYMGGAIDLADENAFISINADDKGINHTIGGYLENRFSAGGFKFVPGMRFDYLDRSRTATHDYRGLLSYDAETDTTLSVAGGTYSSFYQTNPYLFRIFPQVAKMKSEPERGYHSSAGIEQRVGLFTFGAEGFFNYFYDLAVSWVHNDADGVQQYGLNSGKMKVYGAELMIRKDREQARGGSFGWLSYTYTDSKYKSGIPSYSVPNATSYDPDGNRWISSDYERRHALKLVAGYQAGKHTISGRYQLYTSFPYTPIIGNVLYDNDPDPDLDYVNVNVGTKTIKRYAPLLSPNKNINHFPLDHRLDIRYSYRTNHKWGYVSWYIEVINIYNQKSITAEQWKYNKPYSASGPDKNPVLEPADGIFFLPNFGVEVKF